MSSDRLIDCMIDIETIATDSRAIIVSLGAVMFDKDKIGDTFYSVFDLDDQLLAGRTKSEATLDWWSKQSKESQAVFDQKRTPTALALGKFSKWLGSGCNVWGNGVDFDNVILRSCYDDFKIKAPWSYSRNRCFRTLKNICAFPADGIAARAGVYHNALDDAVFQVKAAQRYLKAGLK